MLVKLGLINGNTEIFEIQSFVCAPVKEMNPDILKCEVFDGGKRIYLCERRFKAFYKKFVYKPAKPTEEKKGE